MNKQSMIQNTKDPILQNNKVTSSVGMEGCKATGNHSIAIGRETNASGYYSHAEGNRSMASGQSSHAEGNNTASAGNASHTEGESTCGYGDAAHAEGYCTSAMSKASHAEGKFSLATYLKSLKIISGEMLDRKTFNSILKDDCMKAGASVLIQSKNFSFVWNKIQGEPTPAEKGYAITLVDEIDESIDVDRFMIFEVADSTNEYTSSHAEGYFTMATGQEAHAEGYKTVASGSDSHSEGRNAEAAGAMSHAEGHNTQAIGSSSHAEGNTTIALGNCSHSEGVKTEAIGEYSHSEGHYTVAKSSASHAEGKFTLATALNKPVFITEPCRKLDDKSIEISGTKVKFETGDMVFISSSANTVTDFILTKVTSFSSDTKTIIHVEDKITLENELTLIKYSKGSFENKFSSSHAEGWQTAALGQDSHAEGCLTRAVGTDSHAEGFKTSALGNYSHAEGFLSTASGDDSHAEGRESKSTGYCSHAGGNGSTSLGYCSFASGENTLANGYDSTAIGNNTIANAYSQIVVGRFNKESDKGNEKSYASSLQAVIIGNGSSKDSRSNALHVKFNGQVCSQGSYSTSGADYAEFFEWEDGNINNEDRAGYIVTLNGDKIRKANSDDEFILGVISATPSVIGDCHENNWRNMFLTDDFGRILYEDVEEKDELTGEIVTHNVPKLNPVYDKDKNYEGSMTRKEKGIVGVMGKLIVRDDGTSKVNGYCKAGKDGIATKSTRGWRVLERINENLIRIWVTPNQQFK